MYSIKILDTDQGVVAHIHYRLIHEHSQTKVSGQVEIFSIISSQATIVYAEIFAVCNFRGFRG